MAEHGGARTGAGRPATQERFAGKVAEAETLIAERLPELIEAMFDIALGHQLQQTDKKGKVKIFDVDPNYKAVEYLMNRVMGRPVEQKAPDTGDDKDIPILGYVVQMPTPSPTPVSPPGGTS